MPQCVITTRLTSITHEGSDIGDDWSYLVTVDGQSIRIPEASGRGRSGRNELSRPIGWFLTGPCGTPRNVRFETAAREHDLLFDDVGSGAIERLIECPSQPGTGGAYDEEIRVDVSELLSGHHQVVFKYRIAVMCQ